MDIYFDCDQNGYRACCRNSGHDPATMAFYTTISGRGDFCLVRLRKAHAEKCVEYGWSNPMTLYNVCPQCGEAH